MTNRSAVDKTPAIQSWLRPALTPVGANKDYALFKAQLDAVDTLLRRSDGGEHRLSRRRVLLRDVAKTLLKATRLIRADGCANACRRNRKRLPPR